MALVVDFSVCQRKNCTKLLFTDTTGVYHASNNTGGYESPNMAGSAVTSAVFTLVGVTDTSYSYEYDVTSQIPNTVTGDIEMNLVSEDLDDGIYEATYTVTNGTATSTKVKRLLFTCHTKCCVTKMGAKIPEYRLTKNSEFFDNYLYKYLKAQALLDGITKAGACANEDAIETILELIQQMCNFEDCDC